MELFNVSDLNQASALSDSTRGMLSVLCDMGCSKHVIAALLSMDKAHKDHIAYLTGPVVQHRSPWAESTPPWLYKAITGDRLRIILEEHDKGITGWRVGPAELTTVMYPATMDAPMRMEYADIYLWASAQASARHYGKSIDEMSKQIGIEPVPDRLLTEPSGRYHQDYKHLCSDIRRRVVRAAPSGKAPAKTKPAAPDITTEQMSLF